MVGGDEPQLQVQVVVPLLHADEVEDVVVLHAAHAVDLVLVLPGELVLDGEGGRHCVGHTSTGSEGEETGGRGPFSYLDGEDLHGHVVVQQLRLPHAAEAPPGFHLDQLQGFVSQDGGRG